MLERFIEVGKQHYRKWRKRLLPPVVLFTPFDSRYYRWRYPDLAKLSERKLIDHWNTFGQTEKRRGVSPGPTALPFDPKYYQTRYKDLAGMNIYQLIEHWNTAGQAECRFGTTPFPIVTPFDPNYYRNRYPDVASYDDEEIIKHWNSYGQFEGRRGVPLAPVGNTFDAKYYRNRYPDLAELDDHELFEHWVATGKAEGRRGVPLAPLGNTFDAKYYRNRYRDLSELDDEELLEHWLTKGQTEGRRGAPAVPLVEPFDLKYYRRRYKDVAGYDDDELVEHWNFFGAPEGRRGAPIDLAGIAFDPDYYRNRYPDVADYDDKELIEHWNAHGLPEGRRGAAPLPIHTPFDAKYYRERYQDISELNDEQLIEHWNTTGHSEGRRGAAPGSWGTIFDYKYYREAHPDLTGLDQYELLEHWLAFGQFEGRSGWPKLGDVLEQIEAIADSLDPSWETVLLVLHQASYTGAPILGWNIARELQKDKNLVVLTMEGGKLTAALNDVAAGVINGDGATWNPVEGRIVSEKLVEALKPTYAIANSACTFPLTPHLERAGIPVVAVVHEFAAGMIGPQGSFLTDFYQNVSQVVFPAEIVATSMCDANPELATTNVLVLPQGQSEIPRQAPTGIVSDAAAPTDLDRYLDKLSPDEILVIGLGTVEPRKGVDIFAETAQLLHRESPATNTKFIWVGGRTDDDEFNAKIQSLVQGENDAPPVVELFPPTDNLNRVYDRADILFLASRLDPMPNVAIDAAMHGIPVVCFDGASGFAGWLEQDETTRALVVPDGDAEAAAYLISSLAAEANNLHSLGQLMSTRAHQTFDMKKYVEKLDELGQLARKDK